MTLTPPNAGCGKIAIRRMRCNDSPDAEDLDNPVIAAHREKLPVVGPCQRIDLFRLSTLEDQFSRADIQNLEGLIIAYRGQEPAIRRPCHFFYNIGMVRVLEEQRSCSGIPYLDSRVTARRGNERVIRGPPGGENPVFMSCILYERLRPCFRIPYLYRVVIARRDDARSIA